jgi:hypothetical protein
MNPIFRICKWTRLIPINMVKRKTDRSCTHYYQRSLSALKAHIEKKYVHGVWLSLEDRALYFDEPRGIAL